MSVFAVIVIGYLIGSVPFALVVGKVLYNTDVRQYGSGNLGGGNTGRVLGKKAGLMVMTLDILKVAFVVFLAKCFRGGDFLVSLGAVSAAVGHCYPIFARFKGGKAVATMYGYLFGLFAFCGHSILLFLLPLGVFMLVLYCTKIVALSSMVSAAAVTVYMAVTVNSVWLVLAAAVFTLFMVLRHKANIQRMIRHQENKVTWL